MNGAVQAGEVVAIMGGSGAGKSTLLNVLAGRIGPGDLSGDVLVNGSPRNPSTWQSQCAYVEQDDLMFKTLSVEETLTYSAMLRLPESMPTAEKTRRVNDIIMDLGLNNCRSTRIGDTENRGISGGERKRVSIGIEMVTDPQILFLDEPTSGLDAFTAFNIIDTIKRLAVKQDKIVVLLSAGRTLWLGPTRDALAHFESLGYSLPDKTNPSDFFLDITTLDQRTDKLREDSLARIDKFHRHGSRSRTVTISRLRLCENGHVFAGCLDSSTMGSFNTSFMTEFIVLLRRNMVDVVRDIPTFVAHIAKAVIIMLLLGFIFFKSGNDYAGTQNKIGVLFFMATNSTLSIVVSTITTIPLERPIIKRERAAGTYRAFSAYIAKWISMLPIVYGTFVLILLVNAFASNALGLLIGSAVRDIKIGQILAPLIVVLMLLFGGPLVSLESMSVVFKWIQYVSIIAISNKAFVQNEFLGRTFECPNPNAVCYRDGQQVIDTLALGSPSLWASVAHNIGLAVFLLVLGYIMFERTSKPLMRLNDIQAFMTATTVLKSPSASAPAGQINRNAYSFVTFSWLNPVLRRGFNKPLQQEDLPDLSDNDKSVAAQHIMDGFWSSFYAHAADPSRTKQPSLAGSLVPHFLPYYIGMPLLIPQILQILADGPDSPGLIIRNVYALIALYFCGQFVTFAANYSSSALSSISRCTCDRSPPTPSTSRLCINSILGSDIAAVTGIGNSVLELIMNSVQIALASFGRFMVGLDKRTKRLREFLYGIKIIKYQAAEDMFLKSISSARAEQIVGLRKIVATYILIFASVVYSVAWIQQATLPAITFISYTAFGGSMTDGSPFLILEARAGETTAMLAKNASKDGSAIQLDGASFTWEQAKKNDEDSDDDDEDDKTKEQEPFKLEDVNLSIPRGSLVAVVGSVGSGKSSFLSALIGGMRKTAGSSSVYGSIAYCSQEPWILTGTVEENIHDLEILPNGLGTQIGEKGINLSGGQKARVALARAIARDADIYLLDDPIAALDAHVGKKVFDEAICGTLKSKTVVLVTHQLHLLPKVDFVVVLDNGRVAETGTFKDLMADEDEVVVKAVKEFEEQQAIAEDRREGVVTLETFRSFFLAVGYPYFGFAVMLVTASIALSILVNISVAIWADNKWGWSQEQYRNFYIGIGASEASASFFIGAFVASNVLHDRALAGLMRAPMSFFDTQPIGRIINRMTTDVRRIDFVMARMLDNFCANLTALIVSLVAIIYSSPLLIIQFAVIAAMAFMIFRFYIRSYREMKRLSSILASPLVSHLSETINGIPTIAAFGAQSNFIAGQHAKMDLSNKSTLILTSAQSWLGLRLQLLSQTIMFVLLLLAANGVITGNGSVGLALISIMTIGDSFNSVLQQYGIVEASFNAVERLNYYANDLPSEAARLLPNDPATKDEWPTAGALAIRDLQICYDSRPDHAVIKNLSLDIRPGEKVGIVGRTGSGKSTLMTALFRIMEASKGSITIDGRDIATLGLKTLRSRLQIIPQEPTGYTDDQLWESLSLVGLKDYVAAQTDKLDAAIEENGSNLSMGQRQLLLLIMDEATASVDAEADKRIQESIRSQFAHTTVLSIAHRLNTIAAFDRVLVLDQGEIAEFDAPHVLLGRAGSVFGELVDATGAANAAVIREIASGHFNASQV
ncbi:P-loop containing nucleoside triphosphate hydrolase protein [Entophlyctis helioformis]|nr:P-loop containing nucleoside triphosphate hydrolase protein [Entophlyctis helioformis]